VLPVLSGCPASLPLLSNAGSDGSGGKVVSIERAARVGARAAHIFRER